MSLDYLNPKSNLKAFGMYIFGGSASIGVMEAGYHLDKVLEMTEDMKENNAYHWTKNFNDIPIILPSEWNDEEYLNKMKEESYDLGYFNCPCSSLSQINRNAKVDGPQNIHFYEVFDAVKKIQPKVFFIENAPQTVKLGYPILQDMVRKLENLYKFTIIRDYAGNHGVGMKRMRTLIVGWRKDIFNNKIPLLQMKHMKQTTTKDIIGDLYKYKVGDPKINNHTLINSDTWSPVEHLFNYVPSGATILTSFIDKWDELDKQISHEPCRKEILKAAAKLKNNQRLWDKSPFRVTESGYCPSLTSLTKLIHPIHNRSFTIREYARLMGYKDDFVFYEGGKAPIVQCIAQGVPAKFVSYISKEIREALKGNRRFPEGIEDKNLTFQHHTHKVRKSYTLDEIYSLKQLDEEKGQTYEKLTE